MKKRIGIYGLGRIGKAFFWSIDEITNLEVSLILDINKSIENIAYNLNYY